tara:strand:- start:41038 stop:41991 length:954 start_codon:yes stop_codon:yes gene_type:complete
MSLAAHLLDLSYRIAPGAAGFLARASDHGLDRLADAFGWLPARFSPPPLPLVPASQIADARDRIRVALDPASVFVTKLALRRRDPFEARAAFDLQASRHSPLPIEELETGLALGEAGAWYAAMVAKADLDALRAQAPRGVIDHFVHSCDGVSGFAIRGTAERSVRRTHDGGLLAGLILLVLSSLLAGEVMRDRTERALEAQQAARSELVSAVRQVSEELGTLAAVPAGGTPLSLLIASLDATGQARPDDWTMLSWRFDGGEMVAQFEFPAATTNRAAQLSQSLAVSGVVDAISTNLVASPTSLARLELRAQIAGERP